MSSYYIGLIGIIFLFVLFFLRIPVAYAMCIAGVLGFIYSVNIDAGLTVLSKDIFHNFASYDLSVIPMFVWAGFIAYHSGISKKLFDFAYSWVGHVRGGLSMAVMLASAAFGTVTGSSTATVATMGVIAIPEMRKHKYNIAFGCGSIAAGSILAALIPPSIILIIYGVATEQSIGKLFIAGIIPGILLTLLFIITIAILTWFNPDLAPAGTKVGFKDKISSISKGLPEISIIFAVVIGGLSAGLFTPTEAGAVACCTMLILVIVTRQFNWKRFWDSLADSTKTSAMILLIIAGAVVFGRFITITQIPSFLSSWCSELKLPPPAVMGLIFFIYFIGGMFIDGLALIMMTIPIFYPTVTAIGYDPIWFGVVLVFLAGMGGLTPPVGLGVYIICGVVKDVSMVDVFNGIWPFVGTYSIGLGLLLAFPQIAIWLPKFLGL